MTHAILRGGPDFAMPSSKAAGFSPAARLLRHADFERVYKQGRRHFSASITVFYLARPEQRSAAEAMTVPSTSSGQGLMLPKGVHLPSGLRVGFTVGRALGGAVQRNRMKRRLREAVRLSPPPAGIAADVVINPKKSLLAADFSAVLKEVNQAFEVIGNKLSPRVSGNTVQASPKILAKSRKLENRS